MQEFRIFGPPGTGKTHRLVNRDIPRAVDRFGADKVMVTSFTRAASKELTSRVASRQDCAVPGEEQSTGEPSATPLPLVGTLHSLCWHALGRPELHVKHIEDWNQEYPAYALKGSGQGDMDEGGDELALASTDGDKLFNQMQLLRARLVPQGLWPERVQRFAQKWQAFKDSLHIIDFTDILERSLLELPRAPGEPSVMFMDEAQDADGLQLKLFRSWADKTEWFVLVGDDDQLIFSWAGASPEFFLMPPVDDRHKTVLAQSYRVPRRVYDHAISIANRIQVREPKQYQPRDADGEVVRAQSTWRYPEGIMRELESQMAMGRTVMVLATCSYMLDPLKHMLKDMGIPFHNPYRRRRGDWNPLGGNGAGISSREMLLSFLDHGDDGPYWSVQGLLSWVKYLQVGPSGLVRKQGKKAIAVLEEAVEQNLPGLHTSREVLGAILSPDAVGPALDRNLEWFLEHLNAQRKQSVTYPVRVLRRQGQKALAEPPRLILGTVHSVKGGEADTVVLYPDLSAQGQQEWMVGGAAARDYTRRVFYVGMTRARERLVLASGSGTGPTF